MFQIKRRWSIVRTAVICTILLLVVASGAYFYGYYLQKDVTTPGDMIKQVSVGLPTQVTADKTPEAKQAYSVPPTHPRHLSIENLKVSANVLPVGVTADGAMDAPATAWDVGWYSQSALPGADSGAMLIDGHVNNTIGTPGVFFKLDTLKAGDTIKIERGDGQVFNYGVVTVERKKIEDVDMAKMMRSITPGRQGLNLITCGGDYNAQRGTFDDRVLVYAHLMQ